MPPRKAASTSTKPTSSSSSSSKVESQKKRSKPSSPSPESELSEPAASGTEQQKEEEEEAAAEPKKKKAKAAPKKKEPVKPIHPDLPNNTAFPDPLEPFERPTSDGQIRISSWNVAGLKACEKKGFSKYVEAEDADILCLNETKCDVLRLASIDDRYPYRYWGVHNKKGQAGVAIFSKIEPINVVKGLPEAENGEEEELKEGEVKAPSRVDSQGRIITLEFEHSYLIATYVPNAGQALKTLPEKAAWNRSFERYLHSLDKVKPVIWIGDLNVVPTELDIRNWKTNYNKSAGVTDTEINGFKSQLADGKFVDVWRDKNEGVVGHYSYFSYKFQCRSKGIGWRIDMAITSQRILEKIKQCEIRQTIYGASDHLPIMIDIEGPL